MCKGQFRPCRLLITFVTFLICAFDVSVDWFAFDALFTHRESGHDYDEKLTIALGALCGFATVIFILEVYNAVKACRTYSGGDDDDDDDDETRSVERLYDVITFCQMLMQDAPVLVIISLIFYFGSCEVNVAFFVDTFAGNLVVIGACISAGWTILVAIFNCLCGCCTGAKDCGWQCCCCLCRGLRTTLALLIFGYAIFLFYVFNSESTIVERTTNCTTTA